MSDATLIGSNERVRLSPMPRRGVRDTARIAVLDADGLARDGSTSP